MKDVLLIIHDVYQEDNEYPLSAGYLAAVLEKNGYSVEIYCMDVYHYTNKQLEEKLKHNKYHLIGVGFMAARFKETIIDLELSSACSFCCRICSREKTERRNTFIGLPEGEILVIHLSS